MQCVKYRRFENVYEMLIIGKFVIVFDSFRNKLMTKRQVSNGMKEVLYSVLMHTFLSLKLQHPLCGKI